MSDPKVLRSDELRQRGLALCRKAWEIHDSNLPPEASTSWEWGACYARESVVESLVGDAALDQVTRTLADMASRKIYVPWDNVAFETVTGTELDARSKFRGLIERAKAGEFRIIGSYLSSRLFRSVEDASAVKGSLSRLGIRLVWVGKPDLDDRNPGSWMAEKQAEVMDEYYSRQLSWVIGNSFESRAARGVPNGHLPEGYRVAEWGAARQVGRTGPPVRWTFNQPLAAVIRIAGRRYLTGDSFADLARWSQDLPGLGGATPMGRKMNAGWWRDTLRNPKYAGLHMQSVYQGFKPGGKDGKSMVRVRRKSDTTLIACQLPPIFSRARFEAIGAMAASRRLSATTRRTYRSYLLGGVAYRGGCGHRLRIHSRTRNGARVVCNVVGDGTGHGEYRSWGGAEAFVDRLFAALNLDDPILIAAIEEEIALLTGPAQTTRARRAPRPEATDLKNAIAALGNSSSDIRAVMEARLIELQAEPATAVHPAPPVGSIAERLASWSEAWTASDTKAKNDLLKAAGVQVVIDWSPSPEHRRHISHVAEIRVEEPAIAAALLEAQRRALTSRGPGGLERRDVTRLKVVAPMSVVKAFARFDRHDSRGEAA